MFGGVGIAGADFGAHDAFALAVEQLEVAALDAVALHLRQGFGQLPLDLHAGAGHAGGGDVVESEAVVVAGRYSGRTIGCNRCGR